MVEAGEIEIEEGGGRQTRVAVILSLENRDQLVEVEGAPRLGNDMKIDRPLPLTPTPTARFNRTPRDGGGRGLRPRGKKFSFGTVGRRIATSWLHFGEENDWGRA